jgi:hypothetical protein
LSIQHLLLQVAISPTAIRKLLLSSIKRAYARDKQFCQAAFWFAWGEFRLKVITQHAAGYAQ